MWGCYKMTKVILKGPSSASWNLDGQFVPANCIRDLTAKQIKEAEKSNLIEEYIEKPATTKIKIYTEEELYAKKKDEQLKILAKLKVEPSKENNNLKLEKDRVDAILEAQK